MFMSDQDPGISNVQPAGTYPIYDEGLAGGLFVLTEDGSGPIVGKVGNCRPIMCQVPVDTFKWTLARINGEKNDRLSLEAVPIYITPSLCDKVATCSVPYLSRREGIIQLVTALIEKKCEPVTFLTIDLC